MPPQVSTFIVYFASLVAFAVGIFLHARGINLVDSDKAMLTQCLAGLFDGVGGLIVYFQQKHATNAANIAKLNKTMRSTNPYRMPGIVVAVPLLSLVVLLSGCNAQGQFVLFSHQASIQDKVSYTEQAFTDVVTALNIARANKAIDDGAWKTIVQVELTGSAALDSLRKDADAGTFKTLNDLTGSPGWSVLSSILNQLSTFRSSANGPATRPATGSSGVPGDLECDPADSVRRGYVDRRPAQADLRRAA